MKDFKTCINRVLITTDPLARSIDGTSWLVINYELPLKKENYIHRIGVGICSRKETATAINIVSPQDIRLFNEIKEHFNIQI